MDVKQCSVYAASDLKDYGPQEDGERFVGEVLFVEVENKRGDCWRLNQSFPGVKVEQWEEGPVYLDIRGEARVKVNMLIDAIVTKGEINLDHWYEARCRYGSDAYSEYGQAADLLWEKSCG